MATSRSIGTLQEGSLHAALKTWYAQPGDEFEVDVDGFVIDLRRGDQLIEFQTRSFSALKRKLNRLVTEHPIRLVHPISLEKWVVRLKADRRTVAGRRKSPRRGQLASIFEELVSFPELVGHPNFTLEVLLTREEELKIRDPTAPWRRKGWRIHDRRLVEVLECLVFTTPADFRRFVPETLASTFTVRDLARAADQPVWRARKMAYCLRRMGVLAVRGRRGGAWLYGLSR